MTYEIVYATHLATREDPRFVPQMVSRARIKNRLLGITGVLLFDGDRFCQLLEGEKEPVTTLAASIARDPRHHGFVVLHEGQQPSGRRCGGWSVVFGTPDGTSLTATLQQRSGSQMAEYLAGLACPASESADRTL
jgi:hypothetical protein